MINKDPACDKCYKNKWKTNKKGEEYQCRNCGEIRKIKHD